MNWFNSDYYHILYKNRDKKEAEFFINNLIKKLKIKKNSKILDLACGVGRHSFYLNKKGMNVIGIDNSENNIKKAKKFENKFLKFKKKEMTEDYGQEFDFIFNLFTSFGYINEKHNLNTLKSINNSLINHGILVIDYLNVFKLKEELVEKETKKIGNIIFNIKRSFKDNFIVKKIKIKDYNKIFYFEERVMELTKNDFQYYLKKFDFEILDVYGNYNLEKYHKNSERLIMIIKKSQS
jgi:SAM-dependent methyltransferase